MEQEVRELQAAILAVCETADSDRQEYAALRTRVGLVERLVTEQHRTIIEANESLAQRLAVLHRSTPLPPPVPGVPVASYLRDLTPPAAPASSPNDRDRAKDSLPRSVPVSAPDLTGSSRFDRAEQSAPHQLPGADEVVAAASPHRDDRQRGNPNRSWVRRVPDQDERPLAPVLPFAPRPLNEPFSDSQTPTVAQIHPAQTAPRLDVVVGGQPLRPPNGDAPAAPAAPPDASLTYLRGVSDGLVRSAATQAASMDGLRVRQDGLEARIEEVDSSIDSRIAEAQAATLNVVEERVVTGLDEFRSAQVRMANEQARFEIAAREEIAMVIDRFRLGSERDW
jgi:hypothetical protein